MTQKIMSLLLILFTHHFISTQECPPPPPNPCRAIDNICPGTSLWCLTKVIGQVLCRRMDRLECLSLENLALSCDLVITSSVQLVSTLTVAGTICLSIPLLAGNCVTAIQLGADGITLDLGNQTIDGQGTGINAITANGINNLTIRNGIIQNMVGSGIAVNDATGVTLENMHFINNGTGIAVQGANQILLNNVAFSAHQGPAVALSDITNGRLENSLLSQNNGPEVILISTSTNLVLSGLLITNNQNNLTPGFYSPLAIQSSDNIHIKESNINNNTNVAGGDIAGALINNSSHVSIRDSNFNDNTGTINAFGIEITGASSLIRINRCTANRNSAQTGDAAGILVSTTTNSQISNCNTSFNQAPLGTAVGVDINSATGSISITDSFAESNNGALNSIGFRNLIGTNPNAFLRNQSQNHGPDTLLGNTNFVLGSLFAPILTVGLISGFLGVVVQSSVNNISVINS